MKSCSSFVIHSLTFLMSKSYPRSYSIRVIALLASLIILSYILEIFGRVCSVSSLTSGSLSVETCSFFSSSRPRILVSISSISFESPSCN